MTTGGELQAGCATADITPPVGVDMGGYWERASGAQQIRDPLAAKAVAFAAGSRRIGLIALDLVGLDRGTVLEIRRRVEDETGLSPGALMVCCSHTHSGPLTLSFRGMGTVDSQYLRTLTETAVRTVAAAADRLSPATLRHATAAVDIGRNRRLESTDAPAGYAHVVQIDGAAGPLATIFSYGCHPVALGQDNNAVSADFIGVAARFLESSGNPAMFLNGACGDINPRKSIGRLDDVEELGCELGTAIAKARTVARALPAGDVGHFTESVDLPLLEPPAATAAYLDHLRLVCKARFMRMFMDGAESRRVQQATVQWSSERLAWLRNKNGQRYQTLEVQGLGIGPLRFLGVEGELFSAYQPAIEGTRQDPTILCGIANGSVGYLPTESEFALGGYEIEEAYKVYPSVQMVAPTCECLIRQAAAKVLRELDKVTGGGVGEG